jgi:PAS domain S-box-containing protein
MEQSQELNKKIDKTSVENDANANLDYETALKELSQKQRELEIKNRELFIVTQELEAFQTKYNRIYESSPTGYFTFDKDGLILRLNSTGADQLGASKEFLIQKSFGDFVIPEHRSNFKMHLESVFTYKKRNICELKIERKDKSLFYALLESVPTNGAGSGFYSCFTAISDITMLKVAEESIKESESRFQSMANTAPVLIWITDIDALFTFVNNFWLQYTGRTLGQELGMSWLEGIHPEDINRFMEVYKTSFDSRKPFEIEFRIKHNDGSYKWIISKGVPRFQSDGRFAGYIGSCTDINDQKLIEETIKNFNEELKMLNSSKDKFFSIIAHDLKSPLSGLLGFTEILVEEFEDLQTEEIKEFIGHSHQSAKNINALLENLLEWSRIQIGKIAFEPTEIEVESIFDDIISLFNHNARNKKIRLEKRVDPELKVWADKNMFKTILRNIVSNGLKFTKEGGTITVSAEEGNDFVKITAQDSGVGISEENINKLFKIDVNYTTPGTNKERGTGLGLILCKELVEKNGGKISVKSEIGKGTKFIFTLPKAR